MVGKKHSKSKEAFALSPTLREEFLRFVEYHPANGDWDLAEWIFQAIANGLSF